MILTIGIITTAAVSIIALVLSIKASTKDDGSYEPMRISKLEYSVSNMKDFIERNHEGYSLKVEFSSGETFTYNNVFNHYLDRVYITEGSYRNALNIYIGKLADVNPSVRIEWDSDVRVTVTKEDE